MASLSVIVDPFIDEISHSQNLSLAYPSTRFAKKVEDVFNDFDAAIIATPTSFHAAEIEKIWQQGKHIFCEKPVTESLAQILNLRDLIKEQGQQVFQAGHSERCHLVWQDEFLKKHFLSNPFKVRFNRLAPFKGRAQDVDVVSDLLIHDLDIINWLYGVNFLSVTAIGKKIVTNKWDTVNVLLKNNKNIEFDLTVGRCHPEEVRTVEFFTDAGTLKIDLMNSKYHYFLYENGSTQHKVIEYEKKDHLLVEQEHFFRSILEKKPIWVNFDDALQSLRLMDLVWSSLDRQQEVLFDS